jgi:hypothetical protein
MGVEQALEMLREYVQSSGRGLVLREGAIDAFDVLRDEIDLMRRRYADNECVRLGHILRHALTPEEYYRAEHAARAEHPEAWAGRLPAEWAVQDGGAA